MKVLKDIEDECGSDLWVLYWQSGLLRNDICLWGLGVQGGGLYLKGWDELRLGYVCIL